MELEQCSEYVINSDIGTCARLNKPNITTSYSVLDVEGRIAPKMPLSEICCIQNIPSKIYAPYTIGMCIRCDIVCVCMYVYYMCVILCVIVCDCV